MGLMADIATDVQSILTDTAGFAEPVIFLAPDGTTVTCPALCVKHHLAIDSEGSASNSLTARVTVSELSLTDLEYPVRNAQGDVALFGHKVTFTDVADTWQYKVDQVWPNEKTGAILLILKRMALVV